MVQCYSGLHRPIQHNAPPTIRQVYYRYCKRCLQSPPMQRLAQRCDCCYVTKWVTITSVRMGQSPVQTVPAYPIQIRAHHHIDVYTDIIQGKLFYIMVLCWVFMYILSTLADLGAHPLYGPNSFIFAHIFTKKHAHQKLMPPPMGPHPLQEILDLPLVHIS